MGCTVFKHRQKVHATVGKLAGVVKLPLLVLGKQILLRAGKKRSVISDGADKVIVKNDRAVLAYSHGRIGAVRDGFSLGRFLCCLSARDGLFRLFVCMGGGMPDFMLLAGICLRCALRTGSKQEANQQYR